MKTLIAILLVLLVSLQIKLMFGDGGLLDVWELERTRKLQILENRELKERNRALEAEVADLKQGLEAVEERARSEMGMIKEGETFYQIIRNEKVEASNGDSTEEAPEE